MKEDVAQVDFESRSACNLKASGAWKYSIDPTTEILCLAFRLPHWVEGEVALWHPAFPHLGIPESDNGLEVLELVDWIEKGGLLEAHNAAFERALWQNILVPRHGFPAIDPYQWRCSAAKCAALALPRKLEDAVLALKLTNEKDAVGHKLMLKVSKPRKAKKAEYSAPGYDASITLWHESAVMFDRLWVYCQLDVLAEEGLSQALPDLSPAETDLYLLDQTINERGFQLDQQAVRVAQSLIQDETRYLNAELSVLTGGTVQKATQRAQMLDWLHNQGVHLDNTQAETIDHALQYYNAPPAPKRALEIMRALGKSSTAKYETMAEWAGPDWRVRGGLLFHGATTGRWSGSGVQPHNFPKGSKKIDMDQLWRVLKQQNRPAIGSMYGSVMEALSMALRGTIVAPAGKQLYVADYASIEARVLMWLAGEIEALDMFRRDEDIYCAMASDIYGRPITKDDEKERALGKVAILGLGYQMGWAKFVDTVLIMAKLVIEDELAEQTVNTYRSKFRGVVSQWYDQERAAIKAVDTGRRQSCGKIHWHTEGIFLYATLPSGRRLSYPYPELRAKTTPWGANVTGLTFMGIDLYTRQWKRQHTYGGKIVENIVQAISRDIMAAAMERCEATGVYATVLSVHDEVLAESILGEGSVREFEQLLTTNPAWAGTCPIAAEGFVTTRYRK